MCRPDPDIPRPSLVQRLDPRARLLAAGGAAIVFALLHSVAMAVVALAFGLALAGLARPDPGRLLRRLLAANGFILFLWLTVPPSLPGEVLCSLGPLHYSREGLRLALLVSLKANAILLCFLALLEGLPLPLVGCALDRLRLPPKLVFLFLFTCRYIHVIAEERQKLWTAAALRGFAPRASMHTYRTLGNLLGLIFVNSYDRSRRVHEAMLLRGFNGVFHTVTELQARRRDRLFCVFFFTILLGIAGLDISCRVGA
jgi:cobalt/nickel transport system permease protein